MISVSCSCGEIDPGMVKWCLTAWASACVASKGAAASAWSSRRGRTPPEMNFARR